MSAHCRRVMPVLASDIDVIVAARNAADTVGRAVASALRQPEVREVIVVDDGSSDATGDAADAADDGSRRLRLIALAQNVGPAAARNRALETSQAELVCVLDADDWFQDGRFARMKSAAADDQWDLLADDLMQAPEDAPDTPSSRLLGLSEGERRSVDLVNFVAANISTRRRARQELGYLKPLMRRTFLERANLRYEERLRLGEDYALYAQALLRGAQLTLVPACGYVAVARTGSLSRTHSAADLGQLLAADERLVNEARTNEARTRWPCSKRTGAASKRNFEYRRVLDAKRDGDWPEALRRLFSSPLTTAYILDQTLRARTWARSS